MTNLIGIGGRLTAGKDVVADHLVKKHGWVKMGMSDPLLEMALVLDPIIYAKDTGYHGFREVRLSKIVKSQGYVKAKEHAEVRRFLQRLGTDVGRNMIDENIWTNRAEQMITQKLSEGSKVVVTGIRFPNEIDMIHRLNRTYTDATSLWVERPGQSISKTLLSHESEQLSSDEFDVTIFNDSTIEALQKKVDDVLAA